MLELLSRRWRLVVARGVLAVVFGVLALVWPGPTIGALVVLFGAYAVADGVVAVATALTASGARDRVLLGTEGLLSVAAGGVTLVWPGVTALVLLGLIAAWAIITGVAEVVTAVRLRRELAHEWLLALSGAASVLAGLVLASRPRAGLLAIAWLIGAYAVGFGGMLVALGLRLRDQPSRSTASSASTEGAPAVRSPSG